MLKKLLRPLLFLFIILTLSGCSISFKNSKDTKVVPATNLSEATTTLETETPAPERYVITDVPVTDVATATIVTTVVATTSNGIVFDMTLDTDQDGLTDLQELGYRTDHLKTDSDGDGFSDRDEINSGYNPLGSGKNLLSLEDCSSLQDVEADTCYRNLSISKNDKTICENIVDRQGKYYCVVLAILRDGNIQPCDAIKTDYSEMFEDCVSDLSDYLQIKKPSELDRDAKIVADIKMMQMALEFYYNDNNKYPADVTEGSPISSGNTVYLEVTPSAVVGVSPVCAVDYQYKYTAISDNDYSLVYCLDNETQGIEAGTHTANPAGIK